MSKGKSFDTRVHWRLVEDVKRALERAGVHILVSEPDSEDAPTLTRLARKQAAVIEAAKATYAVLDKVGASQRRMPTALYQALDHQYATVEALQEVEDGL